MDRCCHAVQDKIWVDVPSVPLGAWEFYAVLSDEPDRDGAGTTSQCCTTTSAEGGPCCGAVAREA